MQVIPGWAFHDILETCAGRISAMEQVTIIGAGVVGMCTAVALQQRGLGVRVIDERDPGTGTSFGNAGLVSVDSCVPVSLPGMLKNIPKWLVDSSGPLSVRPAYLPYASSWLLKWIRSGASERNAFRLSHALRQLHQNAIDGYRALLGPGYFDETIRIAGQLHVWETLRKTPTDLLAERLRSENGVVPRELTGPEIFDLMPDMGRSEEHTYELQSLMRISYAVFCLKKKNTEKEHVKRMY